MDGHLQVVAVTRQMFVHGIVEHLAHAMVQGALVGAANIHAGLLANGLQPFELAQLGGVIIAIGNPLRRPVFFFRRFSKARHNDGAIPGKIECGNDC